MREESSVRLEAHDLGSFDRALAWAAQMHDRAGITSGLVLSIDQGSHSEGHNWCASIGGYVYQKEDSKWSPLKSQS